MSTQRATHVETTRLKSARSDPTVSAIDERIVNYPDALLVDFSIEISDTKNRRRQDGVGFEPVSYHDT